MKSTKGETINNKRALLKTLNSFDEGGDKFVYLDINEDICLGLSLMELCYLKEIVKAKTKDMSNINPEYAQLKLLKRKLKKHVNEVMSREMVFDEINLLKTFSGLMTLCGERMEENKMSNKERFSETDNMFEEYESDDLNNDGCKSGDPLCKCDDCMNLLGVWDNTQKKGSSGEDNNESDESGDDCKDLSGKPDDEDTVTQEDIEKNCARISKEIVMAKSENFMYVLYDKEKKDINYITSFEDLLDDIEDIFMNNEASTSEKFYIHSMFSSPVFYRMVKKGNRGYLKEWEKAEKLFDEIMSLEINLRSTELLGCSDAGYFVKTSDYRDARILFEGLGFEIAGTQIILDHNISLGQHDFCFYKKFKKSKSK